MVHRHSLTNDLLDDAIHLSTSGHADHMNKKPMSFTNLAYYDHLKYALEILGSVREEQKAENNNRLQVTIWLFHNWIFPTGMSRSVCCVYMWMHKKHITLKLSSLWDFQSVPISLRRTFSSEISIWWIWSGKIYNFVVHNSKDFEDFPVPERAQFW